MLGAKQVSQLMGKQLMPPTGGRIQTKLHPRIVFPPSLIIPPADHHGTLRHGVKAPGIGSSAWVNDSIMQEMHVMTIMNINPKSHGMGVNVLLRLRGGPVCEAHEGVQVIFIFFMATKVQIMGIRCGIEIIPLVYFYVHIQLLIEDSIRGDHEMLSYLLLRFFGAQIRDQVWMDHERGRDRNRALEYRTGVVVRTSGHCLGE